MYVGQATNINQRWSEHKAELRSNKHGNAHLQKAWKKYGEQSFKFEVLEKCEEQYLHSMENWWCNMLDVHNREYGYNIQLTSPYGCSRHAEETKEKIRQSAIGNTRNLGRIANPDRVQKIRKIKQETMGRPIVIIKADTGEYICEKPSMGEVCVFLGINRRSTGNVKNVLLNRCNSYKGYRYVYKKDYNPDQDYKTINRRYKENRINIPDTRGENNQNSILTADEVIEIRRLHKNGTSVKDLVSMYHKLSKSGLEGVIYYRTWKNVK